MLTSQELKVLRLRGIRGHDHPLAASPGADAMMNAMIDAAALTVDAHTAADAAAAIDAAVDAAAHDAANAHDAADAHNAADANNAAEGVHAASLYDEQRCFTGHSDLGKPQVIRHEAHLPVSQLIAIRNAILRTKQA